MDSSALSSAPTSGSSNSMVDGLGVNYWIFHVEWYDGKGNSLGFHPSSPPSPTRALARNYNSLSVHLKMKKTDPVQHYVEARPQNMEHVEELSKVHWNFLFDTHRAVQYLDDKLDQLNRRLDVIVMVMDALEMTNHLCSDYPRDAILLGCPLLHGMDAQPEGKYVGSM